ncbi:hypothetical protein [Hoeflea prorocentri]|uniref:Excinuclease ABC subunit A n=1 Tax=Hoeflea prorocentri TaxID=1922333 RepID=A0A9X3ZG75_9HYPH|nr:hypothetical protein [Hoeflea prorocentri]MCY6379455.1 hypothetical protein [Hoeflea prorocentri]MDA5397255.1 hypothetical protein [Hoeflea prorocentri]
MQHQTSVTWLKGAAALLVGFGLISLPGAHPSTSGLAHIMMDLAFWPLDASPSGDPPQARLLWAIGSGIIAGWGVMIWMVTSRVYARDPALGRPIILTAVITWFVIDSTGSVLAGAPMNVLYNCGFLLLFVIPLRRPAEVVHG